MSNSQLLTDPLPGPHGTGLSQMFAAEGGAVVQAAVGIGLRQLASCDDDRHSQCLGMVGGGGDGKRDGTRRRETDGEFGRVRYRNCSYDSMIASTYLQKSVIVTMTLSQLHFSKYKYTLCLQLTRCGGVMKARQIVSSCYQAELGQ